MDIMSWDSYSKWTQKKEENKKKLNHMQNITFFSSND